MEFKEFRNAIQKQFDQMQKESEKLFVVDVNKDELWNHYLDAYPAGTNVIFRKQREFECSCCRQFIKNIGNVVSIKNGVVSSIWDIALNIKDNDTKFQIVADAMSVYVKSHDICDIYMSNERRVGTEYNIEQDEDGKLLRWEHFMIALPDTYVNTDKSKSIESICAISRDTKQVFKRSLDEIDMEAVDAVLELIASNSLYKGEEWKPALIAFRKYKLGYDAISDESMKNLYAWENSIRAGMTVGRIRNHSMGTLLTDITNDVDLDTAVKSYETIVAPSNYKRPKAIFTKKMLAAAEKTISDMGYLSALNRRFAKLDDITVNNILFVDRSVSNKVAGANSIFAALENNIQATPKKFSNVDTIQAKDFIKNILPGATGLEVYFENKHSGNLVSLIAPEDASSKTMFKWDNNFSWNYKGNVADSMKERVKAAGGDVEGELRFSIQWNESGIDDCDMDAHCIEPNGFQIQYSNKVDTWTGGNLDIDVITPGKNVAVENITWPNRDKMKTGTYRFFVEQFSGRGKDGFRAEIEFDGQIFAFDYRQPTKSKERVPVADVTLGSDGNFTIKEYQQSATSSRDIWNMKTNNWVPVSVACYSPNYWDTNAEDDTLTGTGHRHLFFMLKDAYNDEMPNGMFNEFLKEELMQHKRVFEALGSRCCVKPTEATGDFTKPEQLSGLGFSMTKRAAVMVKVKGQTERVMKIIF